MLIWSPSLYTRPGAGPPASGTFPPPPGVPEGKKKIKILVFGSSTLQIGPGRPRDPHCQLSILKKGQPESPRGRTPQMSGDVNSKIYHPKNLCLAYFDFLGWPIPNYTIPIDSMPNIYSSHTSPTGTVRAHFSTSGGPFFL